MADFMGAGPGSQPGEEDGGVLEYGKQEFRNDWFVARGV